MAILQYTKEFFENGQPDIEERHAWLKREFFITEIIPDLEGPKEDDLTEYWFRVDLTIFGVDPDEVVVIARDTGIVFPGITVFNLYRIGGGLIEY